MADINFDCPYCGQNLDAPEEMAETIITCPACSKDIKIPSAVKSAFRIADVEKPEGVHAPSVPQAPTSTAARLKPDEDSGEAAKSATVRIDIPKDYVVPDPQRRIITIKRNK